MKRKDFILNLLYSILPIVLVIPLSFFAITQMSKASYDCFFVIGSSMEPYLVGHENESTYGYSDNSDIAIRNLKRFDLIICYYPFKNAKDYQMLGEKNEYVRHESELLDTCTLKVKRVIGLPHDTLHINNETFSISYKVGDNVVTETYNSENCPFKRNEPISNRVADITLKDDEYFVMGDNWTEKGSSDSCNPAETGSAKPIYRENIIGVIFKLEGVCTYGPLKHCKECKKILEEEDTKCSCGCTQFKTYNDIIEKRPYEDGPQYLK